MTFEMATAATTPEQRVAYLLTKVTGQAQQLITRVAKDNKGKSAIDTRSTKTCTWTSASKNS